MAITQWIFGVSYTCFMNSIFKSVLAFASLGTLSACITLDADANETGVEKRETHFGFVLVKRGFIEASAGVQKINVLGGWTGPSGGGLGFKKDTYVRPNPDCQIIFLVESEEQLIRSMDLVDSTQQQNGDKICIAKI